MRKFNKKFLAAALLLALAPAVRALPPTIPTVYHAVTADTNGALVGPDTNLFSSNLTKLTNVLSHAGYAPGSSAPTTATNLTGNATNQVGAQIAAAPLNYNQITNPPAATATNLTGNATNQVAAIAAAAVQPSVANVVSNNTSGNNLTGTFSGTFSGSLAGNATTASTANVASSVAAAGVSPGTLSPGVNAADGNRVASTNQAGVFANAAASQVGANDTNFVMTVSNALAAIMPAAGVTNDVWYVNYSVSNKLTDPAVLADLGGAINAVNNGGHRADLLAFPLLAARFNPTNHLDLLGHKFYTLNELWTLWGFNMQGNVLGGGYNATNGLLMPLPPMTTNTVVICLRSANPYVLDQPNGYNGVGYWQNLYGLLNTNNNDGIWVSASAIPSHQFNCEFIERSNNIYMQQTDNQTSSNNFGIPNISSQVLTAVNYIDTKVYVFASDGHGKRAVWIDGQPIPLGNNAGNLTYNSTNYPSTSLNALVLGAMDNVWTNMISSGSFSNRVFNGEVQSVQVYSCWPDANLIKYSFQAASYVPEGHRADFFHGASDWDTKAQNTTAVTVYYTNTLPWQMVQTLGQNNWRYYSFGGTRLDAFNTNVWWPEFNLPRDKYTEIWTWTSSGRNDLGFAGGGYYPAATVFTNWQAQYANAKLLPSQHLGVLGSPQQPGNSSNANLVAFNVLQSQSPLIDRFFAAWLFISTNSLANLLWSFDTAHLNGTNGWQLVQMERDGLLGKPFYEPVGGIVSSAYNDLMAAQVVTNRFAILNSLINNLDAQAITNLAGKLQFLAQYNTWSLTGNNFNIYSAGGLNADTFTPSEAGIDSLKDYYGLGFSINGGTGTGHVGNKQTFGAGGWTNAAPVVIAAASFTLGTATTNLAAQASYTASFVLNDSAVSGTPSLVFSNFTAGYSLTNANTFALAAGENSTLSTPRVSPNDVIGFYDKSSGSASVSLIGVLRAQ